MVDPEREGDPRVYMAAERTFLAWIRTSIALTAFGFVVARFGVFLREIAIPGQAQPPHRPGWSIAIGLALIAGGIVVNAVAAVRHWRYVQAIDQGRFRAAFGSTFAFAVAALLALLGLASAGYLAAF